jgi:hypothetical protein
MYDAPVPTYPDHTIQAQKRINGNGPNNIVIRMYRDEDYHAVRRLFVDGVTVGREQRISCHIHGSTD